MITMEIENFSAKGTLRTRLESFWWGDSQVNPGKGLGQGSFRPQRDADVMRIFDENSAEFIKRASGGDHFPKVVITFSKMTNKGGQPYMQVTIKQVFISTYQVSSQGPPTYESMSFHFEEGKFEVL